MCNLLNNLTKILLMLIFLRNIRICYISKIKKTIYFTIKANLYVK